MEELPETQIKRLVLDFEGPSRKLALDNAQMERVPGSGPDANGLLAAEDTDGQAADDEIRDDDQDG